MGKTYWMLVTTEEEFDISRGEGFTTHGIVSSQRRKASRITPDDRVLYYISDRRVFAATGTVTKGRYEDDSNVSKQRVENEPFPHRIGLRPDVLLDANQFIDALEVGPRLDYVRRWAPEDWHLAFLGPLHILPQRDFSYIEEEMKRVLSRRSRGRSERRRRSRRERGATTTTDRANGASESGRSPDGPPKGDSGSGASGSGESRDGTGRNDLPAAASGGDGALREPQDTALREPQDAAGDSGD